MHPAFKAWDTPAESLAAVENRIHDLVPADELRSRGRFYADQVFDLFPQVSVSPLSKVVEIGPGVGYIMQGMIDRGVGRVIGLDVAEGMIRHGRERVQRDKLPTDRMGFIKYDGITFPFPDNSVDLFYSVAAIQHIPKPYAYNIFVEISRCLSLTGAAVLHLIDWRHLPRSYRSFRDEVRLQITETVDHWIYYYDQAEMQSILQYGIGASSIEFRQDGDALWVSWRMGRDATPTQSRQEPPIPEALDAQARLNAILNSTWWKAGRPIRAIVNRFRSNQRP